MSRTVRSSSIRNSILTVLFFGIVWAFLQFFYQYHLIYKEQLVLYLRDLSYYSELLDKPASLALLLGDFFTQFFVLKGMAAIVTLLVIILFWDSLRRFFSRIGIKNPSLAALLPAAVEVGLCCHLEYPLAMTFSAALAGRVLVGCSRIENDTLRRVVEFAAAIFIFPLSGAHSLLFILFIALFERKSVIVSAILLFSGILTVFLWSRLYIMTWQDAFTYPFIHGYGVKCAWICFLTEFSALVVLAAGRLRQFGMISFCMSFALAGVIVFFLYDAKEEYDLEISTKAFMGRWDEVEKMGAGNPYRSQTGSYYYNLACAKAGKLPDNLLNVYQPLFYGLFLPVKMDSGYQKVIASADAPFECGDYAQAQHSAMLGMNFTPRQRSARVVKRLAESAVFNGDHLAADRYLGMLEKSTFYRRWARNVKSMIGDGIAKPINMNRDTVFFINDFPAALRNVLDGRSSSDVTLDYLLCFDLLTKNLVEFLTDYDRYYLPQKGEIIPPRIYQEALEMLECGPEYNISMKVKADNQAFLNGREELFKNSYWFYFKYAQPGE